MSNFHHLTWDDRLKIEALNNAHQSVKVMADECSCSCTTIYNELLRGSYQKKVSVSDCYGIEKSYKYVLSYSADIAQQKYEQHLSDKGVSIKLGFDYAFEEFVENKIINEHFSPEAVIEFIKKNNLKFDTKICVRTLYNWIYAGVFKNLSAKHLMYGGKRHKIKKYRNRKRKRVSSGVSIEKRPDDVNLRESFGHWEMDCICGPTRPCLLTLCERSSRFVFVFKLESQKAVNVVKVLNKLEKFYGKNFKKIFRSITVDNGSEFSDCSGMRRSIFNKKSFRTDIYYSHPYSAYERGSNERLNREIRRLVPKGTDLSKLSSDDVSYVQNWVNGYPRGILGFSSSSEVFDLALNSL